jgi:Holliday junction resolvase RusA-like endonuclease
MDGRMVPEPRVLSGFVAMVPPTVTHNDLVVREGRGGRRYIGKSDRLREAEDAICARLARMAPERPMTGPVEVEVRVCFPAGEAHGQGEPMTSKPDVDNVLKTLLDCMVRVGIIEDDRRVVSLTALKAWMDPPGFWLRVRRVGRGGHDGR